MGRVICGVKLFEKRCSRKSAVPLFWLYFITLKLKSNAKKVYLSSAQIFDRSVSRNSLLNLYGFIDKRLWMVPSIELDYLELKFR